MLVKFTRVLGVFIEVRKQSLPQRKSTSCIPYHHMSDQLSITRFRRIIRPLLAKIHALNDLYSKNSLIFDFDISKINTSYKCSRQLNPPKTKQPKLEQGEEELIDDFYNPKSAEERLKSIRLYVSPELYKAYSELFQIVKSILSLLAPKQEHSWMLSSRCAFEIGREMAESTRTTYYRLNNVSLFDPASLNDCIIEINKELYEDLDDWMKEEMEPYTITSNYMREVFSGYIIRLIVIHSSTTLYMFVPVLMHWLFLQGMFLKKLGMYLGHDYFAFPDSSTINVEELNGLPFNDTILVFWSLYAVDYWSPFLNLGKLLEIVPYRISFEIFEELEVILGLSPGYYREQTYYIFQFEKNTNIIVMIMVQIIHKARKKLTSYEEAYSHFKDIYKLLLELVRNWLPYYNTRFNNNKVVFQSIKRLQGYMESKLEVISKEGDQFAKLYINCKGLFDTMNIIGCYCLSPSKRINVTNVDRAAKISVKLGFDNENYLNWLHEQC